MMDEFGSFYYVFVLFFFLFFFSLPLFGYLDDDDLF